MKYPHVRKKLNHESAPASQARRSFSGGMATLGAGLAGSVILPATAIAQATPEAPPKQNSQQEVTDAARSLPLTRQRSPKQPLGKSAASSGRGHTFSKVYPMVPQPLARGAS